MTTLRQRRIRGGSYYWSVIRELSTSQTTFTVKDVYGLTGGVGRQTVANYIAALVEDGYVSLVSVRQGPGWIEKSYRLDRDSRRPPVLSALHNPQAIRRQQLWRAMRCLREFTVHELAVAASTEEAPVSDGVAQNYLWWLRRAGYVVLLGRTGRSGRYRLLPRQDTGPKAPIVQHREKCVLDRNNGAVVNLNGVKPLGWAA